MSTAKLSNVFIFSGSNITLSVKIFIYTCLPKLCDSNTYIIISSQLDHYVLRYLTFTLPAKYESSKLLYLEC